MGRTYYYEDTLPYAANVHSLVHGAGRQIDWTNVPDSYRRGAVLVKLNGAASADDTSITVDALSGAVPADTLLHFGESKEFARTTAAAAAGATSISVEALPSALEDNDEAYYAGTGKKSIPSGKIMAELSGGKVIPRDAVTGAETATSILESTANEDDDAGTTGYGQLVGGVIFENMLPDFSHANFATWQGELETAGVGTGWVWETYSDNTV